MAQVSPHRAAEEVLTAMTANDASPGTGILRTVAASVSAAHVIKDGHSITGTPQAHNKKAPDSRCNGFEGMSSTDMEARRTMNIVANDTTEATATTGAASAEDAVHLPAGVIAPQIAAWKNLATATDPYVDAAEADPRDAGNRFAWCTLCADTPAGEIAHLAGDIGERHASGDVAVPLSITGETTRTGPTVIVPSLLVTIEASRFGPRPAQLISLRRLANGERSRVAMLNKREARQLIDALTAALDVIDGRDDFAEGTR